MDTKFKELLSQGIAAIFSRWTALQMAVQGGWGGADTEQKAAWLEASTVDYMVAKGAKADPTDLEELFEVAFEEEFHTELEDGSSKQVSLQVFRLFESLKRGSLEVLQELEARKRQPRPQVQFHDSSSSCEEDATIDDSVEEIYEH